MIIHQHNRGNQPASSWVWLGLSFFLLVLLALIAFLLIQGLQYHRALSQMETATDISTYSGSYTLSIHKGRKGSVSYRFTLDNGNALWVWEHTMDHPEEIADAYAAGHPLPLDFRYGNLLIENDLLSYQPFSITDTHSGHIYLSQEDSAAIFRRSRAIAFCLSGFFLLTPAVIVIPRTVCAIKAKRASRRRAAKRAARKAARAKQFGTAG